MNNVSPRSRRVAGAIARLGAATSALMLAFAIAAAVGSSAQAAENAGPAIVVGVGPTGLPTGAPLDEGGSATPFTLQLPVGAACTGDSASSDYRVQSYMVPSAVDPNTLTFGVQGPVPLGTGANYRQPLFNTESERYVNVTTGVASEPGGGGQIPTSPAFDFAAVPFASGIVPAGLYNVGIACTRASGTLLDKFWNVQIEIILDSADTPSGLRWVIPEGTVESTTTTTTTEAPGAGTSTTTTSTTVAGATTSTAAPNGSSTTTTSVPCPSTTTSTTTTTSSTVPCPSGSSTTTTTTTIRTTTTVAFGSGAGSGSGSGPGSGTGTPSGSLANTGSSSSIPVVIWAILLLLFGRMAVLLGRKPAVLPANR